MEMYRVGMTKTQIQLPDDLYRRVKAFAARREWSLAETFRRGVEQLLEVYPETPMPSDSWSPPEPCNLGWKPVSAGEMHRLALDDMEPALDR